MRVFRVREYSNPKNEPYNPDSNSPEHKLEESTERMARETACWYFKSKHIENRWIYFYAELDTTGP